MRIVRLIAIFALAIVVATTVFAADVDKTNCETHVVYVGDSEDQLLEKCGEPNADLGDSWVYDEGGGWVKVFHLGGGDMGRRKVMRIEEKKR
jgi:hypothetical protein